VVFFFVMNFSTVVNFDVIMHSLKYGIMYNV